MKKSILHIDVGSLVTRVQALSIDGDKLSLVEQGFCPTPLSAIEDDRTQGLGPVLDNVEARMAAKRSSYEPDSILLTVGAGGEPKAVCAGVVRGISGESAKRAALSAGATVTDLICVDDGRQNSERISDLRRQDISVVVMAGGVDEEILGSGKHQILNMARVLAEGLPKKRWSHERVPLVYAASYEAREEVVKILGDIEIIWADNVRSKLEEEHLESARSAVVGVFSQSVHSDPRFSALGRLGLPDVLPSGHAAGMALEQLYRETDENLLGLSLDGDAVQVFSDMKGVFTRTVTPISKVDPKKVARWLPDPRLASNLNEVLGNLILRPWVLPTTWDELSVFLALWKEAIREGMAEHSQSAIELRGIHRQRQVGETFEVEVAGGDTLLRMPTIRSVVVTGALSHILSQEALLSLVMDGVQPVGVTKVYRDPHNVLQVVGLLSPGAVSMSESLLPLGVLVGPGQDRDRVGTNWAFSRTAGDLQPLPVSPGDIVAVPLESGPQTEIVLEPSRQEDLGDGAGRKAISNISDGFSRVYLDGRPRTHIKSVDRLATKDILRWYRDLGVFPDEVLSGWARGRE